MSTTALTTPAHLPALTLVNGRATCLSTDLARHFGKRHNNVLREIDKLCEQLGEERLLNFEQMEIEVEIGLGKVRKSRAYRITRDGFTLLAMGFTGKKALRFKLAYIRAYNTMEAQLQAQTMREMAQAMQAAQAAALPPPAYMRQPWYALLRYVSTLMTRGALARALGLHRSTLRQVLNGSGYFRDGRRGVLHIERRVLRHLSAHKNACHGTHMPPPTLPPLPREGRPGHHHHRQRTLF